MRELTVCLNRGNSLRGVKGRLCARFSSPKDQGASSKDGNSVESWMSTNSFSLEFCIRSNEHMTVLQAMAYSPFIQQEGAEISGCQVLCSWLRSYKYGRCVISMWSQAESTWKQMVAIRYHKVSSTVQSGFKLALPCTGRKCFREILLQNLANAPKLCPV